MFKHYLFTKVNLTFIFHLGIYEIKLTIEKNNTNEYIKDRIEKCGLFVRKFLTLVC